MFILFIVALAISEEEMNISVHQDLYLLFFESVRSMQEANIIL